MKSNSGNALFIVLIAVALFAAISYAVTGSSRGGGASISEEKEVLASSRILSFETSLRMALARVVMSHSVEFSDLFAKPIFANDIYTTISGTIYNFGPMGSPADPSMYIFHPLGGGVSAQTFTDLAVPCSSCSATKVAPGHLNRIYSNVPGVGTDLPDPGVYIASLSEGVCRALNEKNGIRVIPFLATPSPAPPTIEQWSGSAGDMDAVRGKMSFCYRENNSMGRYNYIMILHAN